VEDISNYRKIYQNYHKICIPNYYKIYQSAIPNGRKIDQKAIKYTGIFHCKNLPKLGFLVQKYTYHLATLVTVYINTCRPTRIPDDFKIVSFAAWSANLDSCGSDPTNAARLIIFSGFCKKNSSCELNENVPIYLNDIHVSANYLAVG
jgi:hypothetical protein